MRVVVHPLGKRYLLDEALALSYDIAWTCAKCGAPVQVPRTRKTPRMVHVIPGCDGVLLPLETAETAKRAAAFLGQNWKIYVENKGGSSLQDQAPDTLAITLEKVQAFALAGSTIPLVLAQSYFTAFLIGFGSGPEAPEELARIAQAMGCGALLVKVSATANWEELRGALLTETARSSQWVVLADNVRVDNKRKKFNRISRVNVIPAMLRENRKAEHYRPDLPQSRAQYLQDILADVLAQGWAKWVRRLILSRGWLQPWGDSFDAYPIQVPHFWLRYWLIKHSLHSKGKLIDTHMIARDLAQTWAAQDDFELVEALEHVFVDTLKQLETRELVYFRTGKFYCRKSFR